MLIEHYLSHFNQGLIFALNNTILMRKIREENWCSKPKEAQKVSK
jgi:hypothetical protein